MNKVNIEVTWMDEQHGSGLEMLATRGINFELNSRIHVNKTAYIVKEILEASMPTTYYLLEECRVPFRGIKEWLLYSPPYSTKLKNYVKRLEEIRDAVRNKNQEALEEALRNEELEHKIYIGSLNDTKDKFRKLQEQKHFFEERSEHLEGLNRRQSEELELLRELMKAEKPSDKWEQMYKQWEVQFSKKDKEQVLNDTN